MTGPGAGPSRRRTQGRQLALMVALLLGVTLLGARHLTTLTLWYDEWWSIYNAGGAQWGPLSPVGIWTRVAAEDAYQSIGYPWLLALWGTLTGWTTFALRALSLLAGLVTVALTYQLGRTLHSPLAGVTGGALLGSSAYWGYYLHEGRTYTVVTALTAGALLAYWQVAYGRRRGAGGAGWALVGCVAGLLYTHYFAVTVAAGLALYHVVFAPKTRAWWRVPLLMGLAGLLFVPWLVAGLLPIFQDAMSYGGRWWLRVDNTEVAWQTLVRFSNGGAPLLALLGLMALAERWRGERLAWTVLLCTLGLCLAANTWTNMLIHLRYVLMLWPLLALVAGVGVAHLAARRVPAALVVGVLLVPGVWLAWGPPLALGVMQRHWHFGWDRVVAALDSEASVGDRLVVHVVDDESWGTQDGARGYYTDGKPYRSALVWNDWNDTDDTYTERLLPLLDGAARVWSAHDPALSLRRMPLFRRVLAEQGLIPCGRPIAEAALDLQLYVRADEATRRVMFGDVLAPSARVAVTPPPPFVARGTPVTLTVLWQPPSAEATSIPARVWLTDVRGAVLGEAGFTVAADAEQCATVVLPTEDVPSGLHGLWLAGTDADGQPLLATAEDTLETDNRALLGTVEVGAARP